MDFKNIKKTIAPNNIYLGDPSKADWVSSGEPAQYGENGLLTMGENSFGTVLSSTRYMWYGNVKARMKTSRGRGVVTAFILFSDVKDEIDFEWVGVDLKTTQTNYYFQGIPDYHHSGNLTMTDSYENFHDYEIRWTPDQIMWLIDGDEKNARVFKKSDTWNKTSNSWDFPQTPSRIQLSLWPAGSPKNPPGTVNWAGGYIDWNSPAKEGPYYFATIESVEVECWKAKSGQPGSNSGKSYSYNSLAAYNNTVVDGDKDTVLGSLYATGLDMKKGKTDTSDSANTIPGGGSPGQDHSGDAPKSGNSGTNGDPDTCPPGTWTQQCGKSTGSKTSASALAIIIAASALFWL